MDFLYKDKDGNKCAAKAWFALIMLAFCFDIVYSRYNNFAVDFSGWAVVIGAVAAIYGWRSNTKAGVK